MCFSATASFTAGAVLVTAGALTLRHVPSKNALPFASIPLLFGIQQIVEGIVWTTFAMPQTHAVATYVFVLFSHVLWPTFVPFSIWLLEKDPLRKKMLLWVSLIWAAVSAYLFTCSVAGPVTCGVVQNSIAYQIQVPYPLPSFFLYFFATCMGSVISSSPKIRVFWTAMVFAFFVTHVFFYPETLFSVWCFFSAVLSLIIYVHVRDLRKLVDQAR